MALGLVQRLHWLTLGSTVGKDTVMAFVQKLHRLPLGPTDCKDTVLGLVRWLHWLHSWAYRWQKHGLCLDYRLQDQHPRPTDCKDMAPGAYVQIDNFATAPS